MKTIILAAAAAAATATPQQPSEGFFEVEIYCVRKVCMVPVEVLDGNAKSIEFFRDEAKRLQERLKKLEARSCAPEA